MLSTAAKPNANKKQLSKKQAHSRSKLLNNSRALDRSKSQNHSQNSSTNFRGSKAVSLGNYCNPRKAAQHYSVDRSSRSLGPQVGIQQQTQHQFGRSNESYFSRRKDQRGMGRTQQSFVSNVTVPKLDLISIQKPMSSKERRIIDRMNSTSQVHGQHFLSEMSCPQKKIKVNNNDASSKNLDSNTKANKAESFVAKIPSCCKGLTRCNTSSKKGSIDKDSDREGRVTSTKVQDPRNSWSKYSAIVIFLFFVTMLPTLIFHIQLLSQTGESEEYEALEKSESEQLNEDEIQMLQVASQRKEAVNMSLFQVAASLFLLLASLLFTLSRKKRNYELFMPPMLNQLVLMGLLPLKAIQMPVYPLLNLNFTLLMAATCTNIIFMVQSGRQFAILAIILIVFMLLGIVQRSRSYQEHELFTEAGLGEPIEFLAPESLSKIYLVHLICMLTVFFILNGMAVVMIRSTRPQKQHNGQNEKEIEKQLLKSEIFDRHPLIVFKVQEQLVTEQSATFQSLKVAYVSDRCKRDIYPLVVPQKIEDCGFQEVKSSQPQIAQIEAPEIEEEKPIQTLAEIAQSWTIQNDSKLRSQTFALIISPQSDYQKAFSKDSVSSRFGNQLYTSGLMKTPSNQLFQHSGYESNLNGNQSHLIDRSYSSFLGNPPNGTIGIHSEDSNSVWRQEQSQYQSNNQLLYRLKVREVKFEGTVFRALKIIPLQNKKSGQTADQQIEEEGKGCDQQQQRLVNNVQGRSNIQLAQQRSSKTLNMTNQSNTRPLLTNPTQSLGGLKEIKDDEEDMTSPINQYITMSLPRCKQYLLMIDQINDQVQQSKDSGTTNHQNQSRNSFSELVKDRRSIKDLSKVVYLMIETNLFINTLKGFTRAEQVMNHLVFADENNGPVNIFKQIIDGTHFVHKIKNLQVMIKSQILGTNFNSMQQRINYDWNLYGILTYHLLMSAMENSQSNRKVFVFVRHEVCIDNILQMNDQSKSQEIVQQNLPDHQDDSQFEISMHTRGKKCNNTQSYLTTTVIFQTTQKKQETSICSLDFKDDPNFRLLKYLTELFGGSVGTHCESDGICLLHCILPLNQESICSALYAMIDKDQWQPMDDKVSQQTETAKIREQSRQIYDILHEQATKVKQSIRVEDLFLKKQDSVISAFMMDQKGSFEQLSRSLWPRSSYYARSDSSNEGQVDHCISDLKHCVEANKAANPRDQGSSSQIKGTFKEDHIFSLVNNSNEEKPAEPVRNKKGATKKSSFDKDRVCIIFEIGKQRGYNSAGEGDQRRNPLTSSRHGKEQSAKLVDVENEEHEKEPKMKKRSFKQVQLLSDEAKSRNENESDSQLKSNKQIIALQPEEEKQVEEVRRSLSSAALHQPCSNQSSICSVSISKSNISVSLNESLAKSHHSEQPMEISNLVLQEVKEEQNESTPKVQSQLISKEEIVRDSERPKQEDLERQPSLQQPEPAFSSSLQPKEDEKQASVSAQEAAAEAEPLLEQQVDASPRSADDQAAVELQFHPPAQAVIEEEKEEVKDEVIQQQSESSYEISACMSDGQIGGESSHQMNDMYFQEAQPFRENPLLSNKKQRRQVFEDDPAAQ